MQIVYFVGQPPSNRMNMAFASLFSSAMPSCICGNQSKSLSYHLVCLKSTCQGTDRKLLGNLYKASNLQASAHLRSWEANIVYFITHCTSLC